MTTVNDIIKAISDDVQIFVRDALQQYSLQNSKLSSTYKTEIDDNIIKMIFPYYAVYVQNGRKVGSKMPPFSAIKKWAASKGISVSNKVIWSICKAIQKRGIAGRPFMEIVYNKSDNKWIKTWADKLFKAIMNDINEYFAK